MVLRLDAKLPFRIPDGAGVPFVLDPGIAATTRLQIVFQTVIAQKLSLQAPFPFKPLLLIIPAHQCLLDPRQGGKQLGHRTLAGALIADEDRDPLEIDPAIVFRQAGADGAEVLDSKADH